METVDLVKKDLSELKDTMTTEVTEMTTAAKEGLFTPIKLFHLMHSGVGSAVNAVTQQLEHLGLSQEEEEPAKEGDEPVDQIILNFINYSRRNRSRLRK